MITFQCKTKYAIYLICAMETLLLLGKDMDRKVCERESGKMCLHVNTLKKNNGDGWLGCHLGLLHPTLACLAPVQVPANDACIPVTHVGDEDGLPTSCLWPGLAMDAVGNWE